MGYLRFGLALLIMAAHLGPHMATGYLPPVGIFVFYLLAGYTATASTAKVYSVPRFLLSRFLRLWPSYFVIFILTGAWLLFMPGWRSLGLPTSALELALASIMISSPLSSSIVPTGWIISHFMVGYALVAVGRLSSPKHCAAALGLAACVAQWVAFRSDFQAYYYSYSFTLQGFAVGAALWHLWGEIPRDTGAAKLAGNLAFPMFLSHYWVGAWFGWVPSWPLLFASLLPTLALSWLLWRYVELPADRFRKSLRATP
jgi:peptidoglycan/LPS O-acetylase OafA/YrhL